MFVYAVHRENIWTTDYNILICSSEDRAKEVVKEPNQKYQEWYKIKKTFGYAYEEPQPPKYRIERLKVY